MDTTPGGPPTGAAPPAPYPAAGVLHPADALKAGWDAFLANPWPGLGVLLVLLAIQLACGFVPVVNIFAAFLVTPALYCGGAWFFLRGIRGEKPPFETAFEGFQRWPSATGAVLLAQLVGLLIILPLLVTLFGTIGLAALFDSGGRHLPKIAGLMTLPVLLVAFVTCPLAAWWQIRSGMVYFTVMEADRPSALEAVKRSFALTRGSVWRIIGLGLLWAVVALVGLVAFCVGILPASLVIYYSCAHAYEQLRGRAAAAGGPASA